METKKNDKFPIILLILAFLCLVAGIVVFYNEVGRDVLGNWKAAKQRNNSVEVVTSTSTELVASKDTEPEQNVPVAEDTSVSEDEEPDATESNPSVDVEPSTEAEDPVVFVPNPYAEWFLGNCDCVAWLKIDDTIVDYCVMWTPEDENYYLNRNYNKETQIGGSLILDTDSSLYPMSTNLIIHGHNNPNQMFGDLPLYEEKSYCDEHKYISLYTKECEYKYEVMAVFRSQVFKKKDTCFKYYKFFNAKTEEEFNDFYDNVKEMSYYDTGVTASLGDHFLTLSTCSYHIENGRFVVVAKLVGTGDVYSPLEESINNSTN